MDAREIIFKDGFQAGIPARAIASIITLGCKQLKEGKNKWRARTTLRTKFQAMVTHARLSSFKHWNHKLEREMKDVQVSDIMAEGACHVESAVYKDVAELTGQDFATGWEDRDGAYNTFVAACIKSCAPQRHARTSARQVIIPRAVMGVRVHS